MSTANSLPNTRSEFDIIISCWTTIFICTWVSIHPNIPPSGEKFLRGLWTRIKLMFWALVVPELILTWALKQWLAARAIEHEFKDHRWTMTQAHFLGMGGFTLIDPGDAERPDKPETNVPNIPVQPKVPEWNGDPDSINVYFDAVNDYWINSRRSYVDDRKKFWDEWESIQKKCSIYSNIIPKSFRDRNLLQLDEEDYRRYERYGHTLPDHITYLRESPGTLTLYRFRDLVSTSIITFPAVTSDDISDKSKGDFLSKAIAILQTTWFIMQCIARPCQGLAITELELATLALASLNGVTYFLWWDKPLDVKEQVKVYFRGAVPAETDHNRESLITLRKGLLFELLQLLISTFASFRASISDFFQREREEMSASNLWCLPFRWLIYLPVASLVKSLYAIIDTSDILPEATHVPTFYATNVNSSDMDLYFMYFVLPAIAVVFGGLHCFGWNFTFPTPAERKLWRVTSLLITAIPLVAGFMWTLNQRGRNREERGKQSKMLRTLLYPALAALLVVYILSRLSLLTQALVLLRRQPQSAYVAVNWSKYIPHIS